MGGERGGWENYMLMKQVPPQEQRCASLSFFS